MQTETTPEAAYDADFVLWLNYQIEALRDGNFTDLDLPNVSDELDGKVRQQRRALSWAVDVLIARLLSCELQPTHRRSAWLSTIAAQRFTISEILKRSPSLRSLVYPFALDGYGGAIDEAQEATGLSRNLLPPQLSYSEVQILDLDFVPSSQQPTG